MEVSIVHNIPSPYRLHLFDAFARELRRYGWGLQVEFMAQRHADRPAQWFAGNVSRTSYTEVFHRDWPQRWRNHVYHFNPSLLFALTVNPPDVILLGGLWDSLTCAMLAAGPFRPKVGWLEANTKGPPDSLRRGIIKGALLHQWEALVGPGREGERYVRGVGFRSSRDVPVFKLPNIVDEQPFNQTSVEKRAAAARWRREFTAGDQRRIALVPARLIPAKGLVPFLELLAEVRPADWKIIIIGDGPLRSEIVACIERQGLNAMVGMQKYVAYEEMPAVYAAADLFVLPSIHDPNPLSVVEAMHSGLPLVISDQTGNFGEALVPGENGWSYDGLAPVNSRAALAAAFSATPGVLARMGARSRELAGERWGTQHVISRLAMELVQLSEGSQGKIV